MRRTTAASAPFGHEMTHGFDDEGRKYDAKGNVRDWWMPEDATRYSERATKIVEQFNGYVSIDSLHVNGKLTQGENIADLGGLKIGYAALERHSRGRRAPSSVVSPPSSDTSWRGRGCGRKPHAPNLPGSSC